MAAREGAQVPAMRMGRFGGGRLSSACLLKHLIALIEVQSCACFSWNYRSKLSAIMRSRTGKPLVARGASSSDLLVFTEARWHFTSSKGSDFQIKKLLWFFSQLKGNDSSSKQKNLSLSISPQSPGKSKNATAIQPEERSPLRAHPTLAVLATPKERQEPIPNSASCLTGRFGHQNCTGCSSVTHKSSFG